MDVGGSHFPVLDRSLARGSAFTVPWRALWNEDAKILLDLAIYGQH